MQTETTYSLRRLDKDERDDHPLTATTDSEAVREAASLATYLGCTEYTVRFFRSADGCSGELR